MKNEENVTKAEAKKAKILAKREALKAKKAAAKQAKLEKKRAKAEAKKAKLEAKRQKEAERKAAAKAKKEERKAKKLARLQKKRERELAKKAKAKERAKIQRQKLIGTDGIDIKNIAKNMRLALSQIAKQMAEYDDKVRVKKAKQIAWMGYDIEKVDGQIIARFIAKKSKKLNVAVDNVSEKKSGKNKKLNDPKVEEPELVIEDQPNGNEPILNDDDIIGDEDDQPSESVETIPVGDTYGDDQSDYDKAVDDIFDNPPPEDDEDEDEDDEESDSLKSEDDEDEDEEDDFNKPDTTNYEDDKDLLDYRREAYGTMDDDGENNDF